MEATVRGAAVQAVQAGRLTRRAIPGSITLVMTGIWLGVSVLAAALVWWDAHRLGMTYGGPSGRDGGLGAPGWAALALLLPIVAVPLYLWRRRRWIPVSTDAERA